MTSDTANHEHGTSQMIDIQDMDMDGEWAAVVFLIFQIRCKEHVSQQAVQPSWRMCQFLLFLVVLMDSYKQQMKKFLEKLLRNYFCACFLVFIDWLRPKHKWHNTDLNVAQPLCHWMYLLQIGSLLVMPWKDRLAHFWSCHERTGSWRTWKLLRKSRGKRKLP